MNSIKEFFNVFKGEQGRMNFFLMLVWASYPLALIFSFVFSKIPILKDVKEFVFPIFLVICLFFTLKGFLKGNFFKVLVFYLVTALVIAFADVYAPFVNTRYIELYLPAFFFTSLPFVFIGNEYRDQRLFYPIYLASILSIFVFFVYHFILNPVSELVLDDDQQSSQGLAYTLLPYMMIVLWQLLQKFGIIKLLVFAASLLMLFLLGSRGPVISIVSFIVLYLIICKKAYKQIWWLLLLVVTALLFYIYYEEILEYFFDFAGDIGYSARIFEMMMEGEISADNGRDYIFNQIINALNERPFGLGLCGAEVVTSGFYAHNLFLELIATFGWVIGIVLSVLIVVFIVRGFLSCQDETERGFYIVLFCSAFVHLMVSGIFLREPFLFMFLGYCFYLIDKKSRTKKVVAHI